MSNSTETSDQKIVTAFWNRDQNAITLLSEKYSRYLYRIVFNILGNNEDTEECLNDTYLKIWNSIPPDNPENFKAYIVTIIRNTALDKHKEKSRSKRPSSELLITLEELESCVSEYSVITDEITNHFLKNVIDEFVVSLSKKEKYIFICRYYCNDSIEAIADSLHLSQSMIYHELAEIRQKLKKKIKMEV